METDEEQVAPAAGDPSDDLTLAAGTDEGSIDDSATGAAVALVVALVSFLLAVTFIILRHVLFHA